MKTTVLILLLTSSAAFASSTPATPAEATSASQLKVRKAIEGAAKEKHHCLTSSELDLAGNLPTQPGEAVAGHNMVTLDSGVNCPSKDKQDASVSPPGP